MSISMSVEELRESLAAAHVRVLRGISVQRERAEEKLATHLASGALRSTIVRQERLVAELRQAEQEQRAIAERLKPVAA